MPHTEWPFIAMADGFSGAQRALRLLQSKAEQVRRSFSVTVHDIHGNAVILAWKPGSSARERQPYDWRTVKITIHGIWIPAIHAGMTIPVNGYVFPMVIVF